MTKKITKAIILFACTFFLINSYASESHKNNIDLIKLEKTDKNEVQIAQAPQSIKNSVEEFTPEQEKIIQATFPPKLPITIDDLRMIYVGYWGFDNKEHQGTIIVNKSVAEDILKVLKILNKEKFPIRRMDAIFGLKNIYTKASLYEQDNTVAFHARNEVYSKKWSQHALGLAIDINPVENPYIGHGSVTPPAGKEFKNRKDVRPGMVVRNDATYNAFKAIGWKWGGNWRFIKDYMHFSKTGH